jgi:high affinity sulfate transporter 1
VRPAADAATTVAAMGVRVPSIPRPTGALRPASGHLVGEVFAGIALAALCLPLNIGYAEAAGLPAVVGIYATLAPLVVYALTADSRHLVIGPDSTIAALLAATVAPIAVSSGAEPGAVATATALLTGAILVAFWALRLGDLVRFLSKSVLVGFIAGLALEVLLSQVRKIMGVSVEADGWFAEAWALVRSVPEASGASVIVGVATIVSLRVLKRVAPRVPAALVTLVAVTVVVSLVEPSGVAVLGEVPSGMPRLEFPSLPSSAWFYLVPTALAIAVLTIAEGLLMAKRAARSHGEQFAANGELYAMGVANVAGALTGAMPSGASASRTAAMDSAGARSQVPSVVAAAAVVAIVLWFTEPVGRLPSAALAGLVANAVVGTIETAELRRLWQVRRSEFGIALGCLLGVLVLGPMAAVVFATLASAVDMMRRAADAPWARLGPSADDHRVGRYGAADVAAVPAGLRVIRPGGPLFFANADELLAVFEDAATDADTVWLVLDLEQVSDLDPTAADALADGIAAVQAAGRVVAITRATGPMTVLLERHGLLAVVGESHLYRTNRAAEVAYRSATGQAP